MLSVRSPPLDEISWDPGKCFSESFPALGRHSEESGVLQTKREHCILLLDELSVESLSLISLYTASVALRWTWLCLTDVLSIVILQI